MPGKAARLELEADGDLVWEHQIAERLGLTITAVREMPNAEFVRWQAFLLWKHQVQQVNRKRGR